MAREKKRDRSIKDVPVTRLLDDFTDPIQGTEGHSRTDQTDEEYIEMMVQKELERKLLRKRGNGPLEIQTLETEKIAEPPPEIPEGSCPTCHYCTIIRKIGIAVYCVCTNTKRQVEGMYANHRMWVRSESELGCHKEPPLKKFQKQLSQRIEEQQLKKVVSEPVVNMQGTSLISEKEEPLNLEPEVMNFFDMEMVHVEQDLVPIDEELELDDSDVPEVFIRPLDPRMKRLDLTLLTSEEVPSSERNEAVNELIRMETVAVHKLRALDTLKKYKRDRPVVVLKKQADEGPVRSEKMAPIRNCESCYFCVDNKKVGGSSWCHCTNIARATETVTAASWVRSRLNAPCWRKEEPL
ncbi:MAG: hypothetical protein ACXAAK_11525 [Candidatus Thorarchaeota archaeon]|jgi:hypothetical protein